MRDFELDLFLNFGGHLDIYMEMPDATILSSRLPRVERKAMRPKRLIKPAKVSAMVQLTNEISRHRVSASADRYNLLRSDRRLSRSKHISEFCQSQFSVTLRRTSRCAAL